MRLYRSVLGRNFYRLPPERQRAVSLRNVIRFVQRYVYPYHPYLRKKYREAGIDVGKLGTYEDFARLPVTSKHDYRKDPRAFILQPKFPTREELVPYDTERIRTGEILRYAWQALTNRPADYARLFRKMSFGKGHIGRRAAQEWMPIHFHASAGSSGDPTPAVYTHYDFTHNAPELASMIFLQPDVLEPGKPTIEWNSTSISLFPGVPHLAFFQTVFVKLVAGVSCFDTCGGNVVPTERSIQLCAEGQFEGISSVPSYLVYWMRRAVEMRKQGKIPPLASLKCVVVGAEPVSDRLREYIKELARELGAHPRFAIVEAYGMTEMKWGFTECDEGSKVHLNPKFWFWEVLDKETLQPVGEGKEGLLVFSHIDWRGTVFVRYNTGDLVKGGIVHDRCSFCGYTFVRLIGPIARAQKDFTKLKGTRVALQELVGTVRDTPGVRNFQAILDKEVPGDEFSRDVLRLRIVALDGTDRTSLTDTLRRRIKDSVEVTPDDITFESDAEKFERELFARTGVKADYVVEKRPVHL